jgi:hypothetical protein
MGQYYRIVNVDKKEFFYPNGGIKLMEFSYTKCTTSLFLLHLLAGSWSGDRVYVIGDYADLDENANNDNELGARNLVLNALLDGGYTEVRSNAPTQGTKPLSVSWFDALKEAYEDTDRSASFWSAMESLNYKEIEEGIPSDADGNIRFIYNMATQEYLDLDHCPVEWVFFDEKGEAQVNSISPLNLLLAIGCGRGGGDYYDYHNSGHLVGAWVPTSQSIVVSGKRLDLDFIEFRPDFTELKLMIDWTKREEAIALGVAKKKSQSRKRNPIIGA